MPAMTLGEMLSLLQLDEFAEIEGRTMTATIFTTHTDGSISLVDVINLES